ncbi:MAG: hypothetical protein AAB486_01635 [Patescibacteria group bacterium]
MNNIILRLMMNWLPTIERAFADGGATGSGVEVGSTTPTFYLLAVAFLLIYFGARLFWRETNSLK